VPGLYTTSTPTAARRRRGPGLPDHCGADGSHGSRWTTDDQCVYISAPAQPSIPIFRSPNKMCGDAGLRQSPAPTAGASRVVQEFESRDPTMPVRYELPWFSRIISETSSLEEIPGRQLASSGHRSIRLLSRARVSASTRTSLRRLLSPDLAPGLEQRADIRWVWLAGATTSTVNNAKKNRLLPRDNVATTENPGSLLGACGVVFFFFPVFRYLLSCRSSLPNADACRYRTSFYTRCAQNRRRRCLATHAQAVRQQGSSSRWAREPTRMAYGQPVSYCADGGYGGVIGAPPHHEQNTRGGHESQGFHQVSADEESALLTAGRAWVPVWRRDDGPAPSVPTDNVVFASFRPAHHGVYEVGRVPDWLASNLQLISTASGSIGPTCSCAGTCRAQHRLQAPTSQGPQPRHRSFA